MTVHSTPGSLDCPSTVFGWHGPGDRPDPAYILLGRVYEPLGRNWGRFKAKCPYCRKVHYHGFPTNKPPGHLEWRIAHCWKGPWGEGGAYWIGLEEKKA